MLSARVVQRRPPERQHGLLLPSGLLRWIRGAQRLLGLPRAERGAFTAVVAKSAPGLIPPWPQAQACL